MNADSKLRMKKMEKRGEIPQPGPKRFQVTISDPYEHDYFNVWLISRSPPQKKYEVGKKEAYYHFERTYDLLPLDDILLSNFINELSLHSIANNGQ